MKKNKGEESETKDHYSLFQREFKMESLPASAVLHVACDDRYRLIVNGQRVANGWTFSDFMDIPYDSYEIAPLLKAGSNVIGLEMFTLEVGLTMKSGELEIPHGVIAAQLEVQPKGKEYTKLFYTDKQWTTTLGKAWNPTFGGVNHLIKPENYNLAAHYNWDAKGAAKGWTPATEIKKVEAATGGATKREPLKAVFPRPMPRGACTEVLPKAIVELGEAAVFINYQAKDLYPAMTMMIEQLKPLKHCKVQNVEGLLGQGKGPCIIENQFGEHDSREIIEYLNTANHQPFIRHASIVLDLGELMNGYFKLEFEGNPGAMIDISFSQILVDGRVLPVVYSPGWQNWGVDKVKSGLATRVKTDRLILGSKSQSWTGFQLRHQRYVHLTFRNLGGKPLVLKKFSVSKEELPHPLVGRFQCSDEFLNKLWEADCNTIRSLVHQVIVDNQVREGSPWGGDCSAGVFSLLAQYGDAPTIKYYMRLFRTLQGSSGTALPIAAWGTFRPDIDRDNGFYPMHLLIQSEAFAEQLLHSADEIFKKEIGFPLQLGTVDWLRSKRNPDGLFKPELQVWYDWSWPTRYPPGTKSFVGNAMMVKVLEQTADLLEAGDPKAKLYREEAAKTRQVLARDFWVPAKGLYSDALDKDNKPINLFSEHAAICALALNLEPKERRQGILNGLKKNAKESKTDELTMFNLPWAREAWERFFEAGESDLALELMRKRYGWALSDGGTTLSEELTWGFVMPRGAKPMVHLRSSSQSANGAPSFFLLTRLLGVRPIKQGFSEFLLAPEPCDLKWAEGAMPSPLGTIPVRWDRKGSEFTVKVTVPSRSEA